MRIGTRIWLAGLAATYLPSMQISAAGQSAFVVVPTPNENFNNGLAASPRPTPSDIWAVGQETIHFDGTKWTAFPAPGIKGNNTSYLGGWRTSLPPTRGPWELWVSGKRIRGR